MTTKDPVTERTPEQFFDDLCGENQPLLARTTGTLRFETDEEHPTYMVITIDKGAVNMSHEFQEADGVVRGDKQLFDDIICGRKNAMAAVLRGDLMVQGDAELLSRFQRLFPGPPTAADEKASSA